MSYLDVLLRKVVQIAGTSMPERRLWNFASGASAVDNPATGATDITITASTPAPTGSIGVAGSGAEYICDGTADDVQINAAIAACNADGGGVVTLYPGTYYIASPVTLLSGVTLAGSGAGVTKLVVASAFSATNYYVVGCLGQEASGTPTTAGTAVPLTANVNHGESTLTFAASAEAAAVAVGDYLFLQSNAYWEATNDDLRQVGEYVEVLAVTATTVTVSSYVRDNYLVADSAKFYRMTFITDAHVRDLEMYQQATLDTRTGNPPGLIGFIVGRRVSVRNCYLHDHDGPAVTVHSCLDAVVDGNVMTKLTSNPAASRYGYGVLVGGASERVCVSNNRIAKVRHAVDAGPAKAPSGVGRNNHGVCRVVTVNGNAVSHCTDAAMSTHSEADGWEFVGNTVSDCNGPGFNMRGRGCRIIGNSIEWCGQGINIGASSFTDGGSAAGSHVIGNSIRYMKALASSGAVGTGIKTSLTDKVVIQGNVISECDRSGIQVSTGTNMSCFVGNTIVDCNLSNASGSLSDGISIDANKSGVTATITFAGTTCTLTKASAGFSSELVGRTITISNSGTAANNGTFTVLAYTSSTVITYTNASGAASAGDVTYQIEGSCDNIFEDNVVKNNVASRYAKGSVGLMQNLIRDYGGANGNMRNRYSNNTGQALTATTCVRTNGANFTAYNNQDGTGLSFSGNLYQTTVRRDLPVTVVTTNATVTTLDSFALATGQGVTVTWTVDATETALASGAGYIVSAKFKNTAGVVTQVGATTVTIIGEDVAGWDCTANLSAATIRLRVTGAAATNIRWSAVGTAIFTNS